MLVNALHAAQWGWRDAQRVPLSWDARPVELWKTVAIRLLWSLLKGGGENSREGMFPQESRTEV